MIRIYCLVLSLSIVLLGCKQEAAVAPADGAAKTAPAAAQTTESAADTDVPQTADAKGESPTLKIALLSGESYDIGSRRGRWVVLNFWATWCAPCLKEMPELDAYDGKRDDLEVIGLAYEEITPEDMRAFLKDRPVNYPIAILDIYNPPAAFGTPRGLPMTYLIAPDGKVAERFMGPITGADLDAAIAIHQRTTSG
jgi:thiol-disulfide isomerase/thioredoxin